MQPGNHSARSRRDAIRTYEDVAGRQRRPLSSWMQQLAAAQTEWGLFRLGQLLRAAKREYSVVEVVKRRMPIPDDGADQPTLGLLLPQPG